MSNRATEGPAQDVLSPRVLTILRAAGDSAYQRLLVKGPSPAAAVQALNGVAPEQLLAGPVRDVEEAKAMLAGLWLWHDALHESHEISQSLVSATGSLWHAILHRREGDFSNAKYWYDRAVNHPTVKMLGAVVSDVAGDLASDRLVARVVSDAFDPAAFVDLVEAVHAKPGDRRHELAIELQRLEWQALFNHCANAASGTEIVDLDAWINRTEVPPRQGQPRPASGFDDTNRSDLR